MDRSDGGEWSRPEITAVRLKDNLALDDESIDLGQNWELFTG